MSISIQIAKIKEQLPEKAKLIAVSKTHPTSKVLEAYETGQRAFGENRVQELNEKYEHLPKDILWHQIGHLQKNKVKYIAPFVHLIHTVDSENLLSVINKEGGKNNRIINCLVQIHIAEEEAKFGFSYAEAEKFFNSFHEQDYPYVQICGLMGMATNTNDTDKVRNEFKRLNKFFQKLKSTKFEANSNFTEISMGMSFDYKIAVEEGSTMVRIGSSIFGTR